jgi:glycosyltransferase involved in cell wall biosynthesis
MQRQGANVDLHATGSLRGVTRMAAARRRVREKSAAYDLAHAQFGSACAVVTASARCRRVLTLRGTDLLGCDTGSAWYRLHGWAAQSMTRAALPKFDRVIVMSHRMCEELQRFHGRSYNVDVVPDGIDLVRFAPRDRQAARAQLGHDDDLRPWVVFASQRNNNPVKRPQLALAAFDAAARQRPELVLHSISGVPHEQIPLRMNAANVLLLTSTREGWPNVVKEALASNVPFVSTDVSDLGRIAAVEPSCVVMPADPEALAAGIIQSIDLQPSLSLRSHVEHMSLGRIAERLLAVYRAVLDSPCRAA